MKIIVKKLTRFLAAVLLPVSLAGCGEEPVSFEQPYQVFQSTEQYGIGITKQAESTSFFGETLCVGGNENIADEAVTADLSGAAGLFHLNAREILYAKDIHMQLYPASTTKILTAYVALKYGDLQSIATVSETAMDIDADSSVCGLEVGDQIDLMQLLYGLMMMSGNDAANVIAEQVSGSIEAFVGLMNQEALALGATNSHFMNPHGLPDEQHYTTVYDLYLIFQAAMESGTFRQIISTADYTANYTSQQGEPVTKEWKNSNRYLQGEEEIPEGITVVGGKTGTTNAAGHCLVLCSENGSGEPYISIVMRAENRDNLYAQMTELLNKAAGQGG